MVGGVCGRGHVWQGARVVGGMHGGGACMAGACMVGGCVAGEHAWWAACMADTMRYGQ